MKELIRLSDKWLNLLRIELDVSTENEVAIALYKKFNFVIEGECKYDIFKQGKYCHTYKMARFNPQHNNGLQPASSGG
jgi:putative acetyltransferase